MGYVEKADVRKFEQVYVQGCSAREKEWIGRYRRVHFFKRLLDYNDSVARGVSQKRRF